MVLTVIACAAWLNAFPAAAEEEKHHEGEKHRSDAPDSDRTKTPQSGKIISGAPTSPRVPENPASPRAPENHDSHDSYHPSDGEAILFDLLFGSRDEADTGQHSSRLSSSRQTSFNDLHIETGQNWYVTYMGLGAGKSVAYYPSNSNSHSAWKAFVGARSNNFGVDFGLNNLSVISTTINSQPVDVSAVALSFSAVGYLPLAKNTDLFLKFGGVAWSVTANRNTAGNLPVTNGTGRVLGAGFEIRDSKGVYFLRLEKEMFRDVYQSKFYTFAGLSLGSYD